MADPIATYRLQLHPEFGFAQAQAIVPYLAELGISHLYLSPILQAASGSQHGYDVIDPDRVSAALGGDAGFAALVAAARTAGMDILLDIVPNHMSIAGTENRWWLDVLENGPASYYAHYFDVDWRLHGGHQEDRIVLPVLAERYGQALAAGHLGVVHAGAGRFAVRAGELELPIEPRSLGKVVRRAGDRIGHDELAFVGDALAQLPPATDPADRRRRHRDKAVLMQRLVALAQDPRCARSLDDELAALAEDHDALDAVLEEQAYRLVHWSVASDHLTYRRFFDIDTLVGIRNELPDVFAASHARIISWLVDKMIAGVRVDHVDGLRDPQLYLERLRLRAPDAWIVVEKILAAGEELPPWPIDGTTGYEFIDRITGLFVDPAGEAPLTEAFGAYTNLAFDPQAASRGARKEVMTDALHSELARLVELATRACAASPQCRDYTRGEIEAALAEILAGYPTYRTYLREGSDSPRDRARIAGAVAAAGEANPQLDRDLLGFLDAALAFELALPEAIELAKTTQQTTGALSAKGDEDTVAYRLVRLVARCEVGSDLRVFACEPAAVHRALAAGPARALLATSTHDTKRGKDVRARIAVLSEIAPRWTEVAWRWRARTESHWGDVEPDRVLEYAMWQTLVGAWPVSLDRARQYALKAVREARLRTSWRRPDEAYEAAMNAWLDGVFADRELVADIDRFVASIAAAGDRNALAQLLVKLIAPGVPDFYQGAELRDGSLVDPDNRRAVDFDERRAALARVRDATIDDIARANDLGLAKLWTIQRVLGLRRKRPDRFAGPYAPLQATGPHAHRVFAARRGSSLVAVVPRLSIGSEGFRDTWLVIPDGQWRDVLSDRTLSGGSRPVAELWAKFPIALLVAEPVS